MQTRDFDYHLPRELIAQQPPRERTQARLMLVSRSSGGFRHYHASDLPSLLHRNDLLVLNDTRVIPALVFGRKQKTGGKVEVLFIAEREAPRPDSASGRGAFANPSEAKNAIPPCHDSVSGQIFRAKEGEKSVWEAFLHSSGRPRAGDIILLADGKIEARVKSIGEYGRVVLEIYFDGDFFKILGENGLPPLPPYIKRPENDRALAACRQLDHERYQTVYARVPGAIAAPTAGLHFSENLLAKLHEKGVQTISVTLHVGPGTFLPVRCGQIKEHKMEPERFVIEEPAAQAINNALAEKRRIIAVGTTVVRALESAVNEAGKVRAGSGTTDLFIYPSYLFELGHKVKRDA